MKLNKFDLDIGCVYFRVGVFLLASAPVLALISFLVSLIISLFKEKLKIFKDKWNYLFFVAAIMMLINAFLHQIKFDNLTISSLTWDPSSSFIGLFNWLPLFFCL